MAVKLTKNEQKLQKDRLKQYQRYLPTLQLKKQQLQMVIRQIEAEVAKLRAKQEKLVQDMQSWIAVYNENTAFSDELKVENLIKVDRVVKAKGNIAGVNIPVFKELTFIPISYDLNAYPLWVDKALESLRDCARYDALIGTLEQQIKLLGRELRTTSQRVNLFEKVKIPEAKTNIRKIGIYLGDQQTAAVVRGKIAKKKLMQGA
ncbi:MAG: V-type ATP synthase subunit D [Sphaerochaeta sp.]|uniref:V-type ATP synthase subunit D n=1 Tax=Sphaerochaeta sp. TaxID=1972642 RepID=UPI001D435262|nr:V-type ATP synthase subunit D [uncultured Sphaerochaeta sp.]MDD3057908.1 V-type ATP synthase subunit D [Sphaerochaeta sp.]MDD3928252.1 V-type ATP synthase subunit D [Sphaerochaeta sp.]NCC14365.1 V-type ATP synthase subunit D [Spirochaetia bacterium]NCC89115.1 V-type ATP synthase subunit D [Spirochaetia bacterium]